MPKFAGQVTLTSNVKLQLIGPDGVVKETREANTVTTSGKNGIADQLLASPTLGKPTHFAIGTGTPGSNALGTETGTRVAVSKSRSTNVMTATGTFAAGNGTAALTEAGMADASTVGNFWTTATFAVINKGANDTLAITWTLTIS